MNIDKDKKLFLTVFEYFISSKDIEREKAEEILKEIGGEQMPSLAQRLVDEGMQQGLQQGMQQGIQQGLQKGIKKGMQQGMQKGLQKAIIDAIELKFGTVPSKIRDKITNTYDSDKLREIHKLILLSNNIDELYKIK